MSNYCTYYVTCMYTHGSRSTSFIQLSHTSQKDACVDTLWHCCLKCHQKKRLCPALILRYTLQEEDQFLCIRLIVPCFSMVIDCIIIPTYEYVHVLLSGVYYMHSRHGRNMYSTSKKCFVNEESILCYEQYFTRVYYFSAAI